MSGQLKTGDRVILKSGGEVMTVRKVDEKGVHCSWFEGKTEREEMFDPEMLNYLPPVKPRGRLL
jgi:uncharacterized protein YodC (DUF2158 family)